MKVIRTTQPSTEPITTAEVEEKLVLSDGWDTTTISTEIEASRMIVEMDTDRSLITQSWTLTLKTWPKSGIIRLPKGNVASITSFSYLNADGDSTALVEDTDYYLDDNSEVAELSAVTSWPALYGEKESEITVVYVTGEATAPAWSKEACLAKVQLLYSAGAINTMEIYKLMIATKKLYFDYRIND